MKSRALSRMAPHHLAAGMGGNRSEERIGGGWSWPSRKLVAFASGSVDMPDALALSSLQQLWPTGWEHLVTRGDQRGEDRQGPFVCVCVCVSVCLCVWSVAQSCPALCNCMDCSPPGSSVHGIFTRKNTGVGCHFLLQGIFPIQVLNPNLLHRSHCRWILYC